MMFPRGEVVPLHQLFAQLAFYNQADSQHITKKSKVIPYQENVGEFLLTGFRIPNKGQVARYQSSVIALFQGGTWVAQ